MKKDLKSIRAKYTKAHAHKVRCKKCGHMWESSKATGHTCPKCGMKA